MANMAPQGVATHLSVNGLIGVTWTGAGLGIIFASIRFGIRIKRMKRLLVDDYFVLLALSSWSPMQSSRPCKHPTFITCC